MNLESSNVEFTKCKFGKKFRQAWFMNHKNGLNYSVEATEVVHPHLRDAMEGLRPFLASSFHVEGDEQDNFIPDGFIFDTKKKKTVLEITGILNNVDGYKRAVKSGFLLYDENESLKAAVCKIQDELYEYFFNDKTAQGKLGGEFDQKPEPKQEKSAAGKGKIAPEETAPVDDFSKEEAEKEEAA